VEEVVVELAYKVVVELAYKVLSFLPVDRLVDTIWKVLSHRNPE
jgi:hypothetical protein